MPATFIKLQSVSVRLRNPPPFFLLQRNHQLTSQLASKLIVHHVGSAYPVRECLPGRPGALLRRPARRLIHCSTRQPSPEILEVPPAH